MPAARSPRRGIVDWREIRRRLGAAMTTADLQDAATAKHTLDERARLLARPLSQAQLAPRLELVNFRLAAERYAIEANFVVRVVRLQELIRLPDAPEHLMGLTSLRGEILPVFDLRALLDLPRSHLADMSRLIVLGNGSAEFGLLADVVEEVAWLEHSQIVAPPGSLSRVARSYMHGVTANAVIVLDGGVLLRDPRLVLDSAGPPPPHPR